MESAGVAFGMHVLKGFSFFSEFFVTVAIRCLACSNWALLKCTHLLAHGFGLAMGAIMLQSILIIGADAASSVTRLCAPARPAGQRFGWRFCICVTAWLCVLGAAAPVLIYVFKQPVLIVLVEVSLAAEFYIGMTQSCLGAEGSAALPSGKIHSAVRTWTEMAQMQREPTSLAESIQHNIWVIAVILNYIAFNYAELTRAPIGSCVVAVCFVLGIAVGIAETMAGTDASTGSPLKIWRLLWRTTLAPICSGGGSFDDCSEHGVCAVCLSNLCKSAEHIANERLAQQSMVSSAMSACRMMKMRSSCVSLSAVRSRGLKFGQDAVSGIWSSVATLPCGHSFHAGCIYDAARTRLQCPTCRRNMGDSWGNLTQDEKLFIIVGCATIWLFQVVVMYCFAN